MLANFIITYPIKGPQGTVPVVLEPKGPQGTVPVVQGSRTTGTVPCGPHYHYNHFLASASLTSPSSTMILILLLKVSESS